MSFSASINFFIIVVIVVTVVPCGMCVCVCLFIVFGRHVHLDPDVGVHCGTENSFFYIIIVFLLKMLRCH